MIAAAVRVALQPDFLAIEDRDERIYADSNNRRDAQTAELKAAIDNPGWFATVFGNRYVQLALVSLGSYFATERMK